MKRLEQFKWAIMIGLSLLAWTSPAQVITNVAPKTVPERIGRILEPLTVSGAGVVATRPDVPERPALSDDIRTRLQRFELLREAYLAEQRELKHRFRTATDDEDRQRIRDLIKERREAWLEAARSFREQAKDRLAEVKDMLPQHREVLDSVSPKSSQSLLDGVRDRDNRKGIGN